MPLGLFLASWLLLRRIHFPESAHAHQRCGLASDDTWTGFGLEYETCCLKLHGKCAVHGSTSGIGKRYFWLTG
ncbi:hypothetical protein AMELA_G00023070 [Ameiurus melas]|uniref:Secreted protein n=1 Tax=Ameiurus melas TaxID=219545 RepID=A0A7J6BCI5_AMEME|nr:hypothetical protein AMELA_G00023070 [Ameiurus melas]